MYKDISSYGLIGDMHAVALVSTDGSIDYCSMPHIDSPTVFASLLDDEKKAFWINIYNIFIIHGVIHYIAR